MDKRVKHLTKERIEEMDANLMFKMGDMRDKIRVYEKMLLKIKPKNRKGPHAAGATKIRKWIDDCNKKIDECHKQSFELWKKYNGIEGIYDPNSEEDTDVRPYKSESIPSVI